MKVRPPILRALTCYVHIHIHNRIHRLRCTDGRRANEHTMGRARGPPHLHRTGGVDVDDAAVEASGVTGDTAEAELQAACDTLSRRQQPRIRRAGTRSPARAGVRVVSRSESGLVRTRGRRGHEAPAFARATKKRQGVSRPHASRDGSLSATDVIAAVGAYARLGTIGRRPRVLSGAPRCRGLHARVSVGHGGWRACNARRPYRVPLRTAARVRVARKRQARAQLLGRVDRGPPIAGLGRMSRQTLGYRRSRVREALRMS